MLVLCQEADSSVMDEFPYTLLSSPALSWAPRIAQDCGPRTSYWSL
jgi:hypothetical protein